MRQLINAFTIDVEDYFQVSALAAGVPRNTWDQRELRVERNTERLLSMLDEHGVRGTFFVLGWVADRVPSLVKRIAAAGHEVACHGYSHELIYRQTPEVFREETVRAKRLLEDAIGAPVIGYRAASFSITQQSRWALDVLADLDFLYDSSIFPIQHDRYGIPGASIDPGKIEAPSGRALVEFPMSTAGLLGMRLPVSGGGYFRQFPYWVTRTGLRSINARGVPFTFYLHPWEIDAEQPRVPGISMLSKFRHYTNLSRCEGRLRRVLADFRFSSMRDVLTTRGLLQAAPLAA